MVGLDVVPCRVSDGSAMIYEGGGENLTKTLMFVGTSTYSTLSDTYLSV